MPTSAPTATDTTRVSTGTPKPFAFDPGDLDELIPPPLSPWRKLAAASILVALAISWVWLAGGGYLMPKAPNRGDFNTHGPEYVDHDEGLVAIVVWVPNSGSRELRLTDVGFDAPGAEVVRVEVAIKERSDEPEIIGSSSSGSEVTIQAVPAAEFFAVPESAPLPIALPVRSDMPGSVDLLEVLIWIRPTQCTNRTVPWGDVELTLDFGDGAFPWFSRTFKSTEPAWTGGSVSMWGGEDFVEANSPLALACEVLR